MANWTQWWMGFDVQQEGSVLVVLVVGKSGKFHGSGWWRACRFGLPVRAKNDWVLVGGGQ